MSKNYSIIKIRRALIILSAAAVLLFAALLSNWLKRPPDRSEAIEKLNQASLGLPAYSIDAVLRPDENTLAVTQEISWQNDTGDTLDRIVLRTFAGAYAQEETSPAATTELFEACYGSAFSAGGISLSGAWVNDTVVTADFQDAARTVLSVPVSLKPGETAALRLRFTLTIPSCAHRFGVSQGVYRFGNALPVLAVYEDGAWRTEASLSIGDPSYTAFANWTFALSIPSGYEAVASAPLARENGRLTGSLPAARDFAFAVSKEYLVRSSSVEGIALYAAAKTAQNADLLLKHAASALSVYQALYGDYPYEAFSIAALSSPFDGIEYPGFVLIADTAFEKGDSLELLIAHETAHQWFYAKVGSDSYYNAWQDEATAEWAMLRYTLKRYGQSSMEALRRYRVDEPMKENIGRTVTPGSPLSYFSDMTEYQAVVYGRGTAFLCAVDQMTEGRLDEFLRAYCERFAYQNASRKDFEEMLNAYFSMDFSPLAVDYLDTYLTN